MIEPMACGTKTLPKTERMWATLLLVLLLATSSTVSSSPTASPIQHVVVLMMENRSFDHLLGWLHKECPELDGLTGIHLFLTLTFFTKLPADRDESNLL